MTGKLLKITATVLTLAVCALGLTGATSAENNKLSGGDILEIKSIGLTENVLPITLEDHEFQIYDNNVGYYRSAENKLLIMGHRNTVFQDAGKINVGDIITYAGENYEVISTEIYLKDAVDMAEIMQDESVPTLVLMTCAGTYTSATGATHRLVIYAIKL